MKKNIILEVSRIKEIMGLINEQDEETNVNPDSWEEYGNGEPAELFEEKATNSSKKYMNADLEGDTTIDWVTTSKFRKLITDIDERFADSFKEWKVSPVVGEYLYSPITSFGGVSFDRNNDVNPDFNPAASRIGNTSRPTHKNDDGDKYWGVVIPSLTSEEKLGFMQYIEKYVNDNYGGSYQRASRKIESIVVKKGKITEQEGEINEKDALLSDYSFNGVENDVFVNNSWELGEDVKRFIDETRDLIRQTLSENPGTTAEFTNTVEINGKKTNTTYSISTSASRIRNTGQAKDMTFAQLSQRRAQSVDAYVRQQLESFVRIPEPTINPNGTNGDGSSGPNPPSPYQFFNRQGELIPKGNEGRDDFGQPLSNVNQYERFKYCRVVFAVKFRNDEEKPSAPPIKMLGEWSIDIRDGREGGGKIKIKFPPLKWNKGGSNNSSGGGHISCAAYN